MFCGECGTKNDNSSKFCLNCGAVLSSGDVVEEEKTTKKTQTKTKKEKEEEKSSKEIIVAEEPSKESVEVKEVSKEIIGEPKQSTENKIKKNNQDKKFKNIIIVFLLLAIGVGGSYYYIDNYIFTPEVVADEFMSLLEDKKYKDIFDIVISEESDFVTKENFAKYFEENNDIEIDDYKIKDVDVDDDEALVEVEITYSDETEVDLEFAFESKSNKYLIFKNWLLDSEMFNIVMEDYVIYVPKNSEVKIDDKKVSDEYYDKKGSTDDEDVYIIPEILYGSYNIEVILSSGLSVSDEMFVSSYEDEFEISNISSDNISDNDKETLASDAMNLIQEFYNDAILGSDFSEIKDKYDFDGIDIDVIEDDYNDMVENVNGYFATLTAMEIANPEFSSIELEDDGSIYISISIDLDYKLDYYSYGSEEPEEYDNSDDDITMSIKMKMIDDEYRFVEVGYLKSYFSIY